MPQEITEKAQIVVTFNSPGPLIMRYATTRKAEKELKALLATWRVWHNKGTPAIHALAGDMFDATVDLSAVRDVCYVDLAVRAKFVPFT